MSVLIFIGALVVALFFIVFSDKWLPGLGAYVSFSDVLEVVLVGLVLFVILPWLARTYGGVFGAPGRLLGWVWNKAVKLFMLPLSPISRRIDRITPAGVDTWLGRKCEGASSYLLRGERRLAAEHAWPPKKYPTLYRDIPADVRRSVVWDGRLIGDHPVTWLGWRHITAEVVSGLAQSSGRIGVRAAAVLALLSVLAVLLPVFMGSHSAPYDYPDWSVGISIKPRLEWYLVAFMDAAMRAIVNLGLVPLGTSLMLPGFMLFAFWRGMNKWWAESSSALATPTRDSLVVWKARTDIRSTEYAAYCRQVDRAIQLQSEGIPTIKVGLATGVLRARGDMEAPERGQEVCLDGETLRQHTLILGGTGTGKTRLAIRPMFRRIMEADWGKDHKIGAYVTDGKGTLWKDVKALMDVDPKLKNRTDVVIVGTEKGHKSIDPLAGMTPMEIATTFKAVSGQVLGASTDDFWPESASLLMMHCATIASVLEQDPNISNQAPWNKFRPFSLLGIGRLCTDLQAAMDATTHAVALSELDPEDPLAKAANETAVIQSVIWLRGTWAEMAKETRSGVVANINSVIGKLAGAGVLRERFCTGMDTDNVDVTHALDGGILLIAVGETDWGVVGKVINVWLKTRLYIGARKRLQATPEKCRNTSCALFADEWQMLATTGPDSDATFWNVARETGVFLIAATQSLAALDQAIGEPARDNLVNLLRTKIVLKTEEAKTLDYFIHLAGTSMRGTVLEDDFYETQGQRELARPDFGVKPDTSEAVSIGRVRPTVPRISTLSQRPIRKLDLRFVSSGTSPGQAGQVLGQEQAAYWRQEDSEKEAQGRNIGLQPKLTTDELLLGSGLAFAIIQRAGCDRSDIIDLQAVA